MFRRRALSLFLNPSVRVNFLDTCRALNLLQHLLKYSLWVTNLRNGSREQHCYFSAQKQAPTSDCLWILYIATQLVNGRK